MDFEVEPNSNKRKEGSTLAQPRTVPDIPRPFMTPSKQALNRMHMRRKLGLSVLDPSSEDIFYHRKPVEVDSKQNDHGDSSQLKHHQQSQYQSGDNHETIITADDECCSDDNVSEQHLHDAQSQKELKSVSGEWVEYYDDEIEAKYYYNSTTGEATWINPARSKKDEYN